jgi:hypothetical protein
MALATKYQTKTGFVTEFLTHHPKGNVKAVNEAWTDAGMEGTIGSTLVNKMRAKMGLTGNLRAKSKTRTAAMGKIALGKPTTAVPSLGKTSFVKEFLNDNPRGNVKAVNEAWEAAGFDGTISATLVNQMRALLGLAGNLRAKSKTSAMPTTTGTTPGRPPKDSSTTVNERPTAQSRDRKNDRTSALLNLEVEIDRLIFSVMGIGNLAEIETALREARRKVYGALSSS